MHNSIVSIRRCVAESHHAQVRKQQRCIPNCVRDWVLDFGIAAPAGSGIERYTFDKKGWRMLQSYLGVQAKNFEKYRGVFVLLSGDGVVVTEGWVH